MTGDVYGGAAARRINYKSDFDFIMRLTDCNGNAVGFPACDWTARLYTTSKANAYVVSCVGGVCANCYDDNGEIHVVVDGHRLGVGRLNVEFVFELPNRIYPDGSRREVTPVPLGIELITGAGDCTTGIEVEAVVPYAVIDAYDMAREAGYAGTRDDYVAQLVQLGDTAAMVSDFKAGKSKVADALTRRGYPTAADAPFDEMARTITDMDYRYTGWLSAIGYPEDMDYGFMSRRLAYSARKATGYTPGDTCLNLFKGDTELVYAPMLDISLAASAEGMFSGCTNLETVPDYDFRGVASASSLFAGCRRLERVPERIVLESATTANSMFSGAGAGIDRVEVVMPRYGMHNIQSMFANSNIRDITLTLGDYVGELWPGGISGMFTNCKAERITFDFCYDITYTSFGGCANLRYLLWKKLGSSQGNARFGDLVNVTGWGYGSEENRRSLVDTLLTYSHDRAAAGWAAATVPLAEQVKARLTPEEIAAITAKGYTIA